MLKHFLDIKRKIISFKLSYQIDVGLFEEMDTMESSYHSDKLATREAKEGFEHTNCDSILITAADIFSRSVYNFSSLESCAVNPDQRPL